MTKVDKGSHDGTNVTIKTKARGSRNGAKTISDGVETKDDLIFKKIRDAMSK